MTRHCSCVLHGNKYDWVYVDRLHSMIQRHSSDPVEFHVFTESHRTVPDWMIRHDLTPWPGISGPKKSWWYKMQMFDSQRIPGPMLYLDLDVIITKSLDWIWDLDPEKFWTIRDFRRLWRPQFFGINSSLMFWDTRKYHDVWEKFSQEDLVQLIGKYHGDQDYLDVVIDKQHVGFVDENIIKSWRWEVMNGGLDFRTRKYRNPDSPAQLDENTHLLVFHGSPKPHECTDPIVTKYWA